MGKVRLNKCIVLATQLELGCLATDDDFDFIPVAMELDEPIQLNFTRGNWDRGHSWLGQFWTMKV